MSSTSASKRLIKAPQGCWTCKARKVGCDRGQPACNNCIRTERHCRGYGLRLQWHDKLDGRRKNALVAPKLFTNAKTLCRDGSHKHFINFTFEDLIAIYGGELDWRLLQSVRLPRQLPSLPSLGDKDSRLLAYYELRVSPMISTLDSDNGFKTDLLPMALSASEPAAVGLRNAMMAVAAYHSADSESALPYKFRAIRFLSQTLSTGATDAWSLKTQLATSMMLCVHSVFDESETDWLVHLAGARRILWMLANRELHSTTLSFLSSLFYYHYVLGDFVRPVSSRVYVYPECQLEGRETTILGSLGCSLQLLQIVHHINQMRFGSVNNAGPGELTDVHLGMATTIRSLEQNLCEKQYEDCNEERSQASLTAELYRIATLLYLYAVCSDLADNMERDYRLDQALKILQQMTVCTSPWPLFIVAGEVTTDAQRILILDVLERMDSLRNIGNVFVVRRLIEAYWKQLDLSRCGDKSQTRSRIWQFLSTSSATPWFI